MGSLREYLVRMTTNLMHHDHRGHRVKGLNPGFLIRVVGVDDFRNVFLQGDVSEVLNWPVKLKVTDLCQDKVDVSIRWMPLIGR